MCFTSRQPREGRADSISATAPETTGVAAEVPFIRAVCSQAVLGLRPSSKSLWVLLKVLRPRSQPMKSVDSIAGSRLVASAVAGRLQPFSPPGAEIQMLAPGVE